MDKRADKPLAILGQGHAVRRDQRYGCISICGAAGVASAIVIERAQLS